MTTKCDICQKRKHRWTEVYEGQEWYVCGRCVNKIPTAHKEQQLRKQSWLGDLKCKKQSK